MKIRVDHLTRYRYEAPVRMSTQYLRLVPRDSAQQKVLHWKLESPGRPTQTLDGYGNVLHVLTLDTPMQEITIRAVGVVETHAVSDVGIEATGLSPLVFTRATPATRMDAAMADFAEHYRRRASSLTGLRELASGILRKMPFTPGETGVASSAAQAFALASGVCQDHAHVFVACCRYLGVPARYVSGYVYSALNAGLQVASHAWAEAWVVDRWRSFDVANDRAAGEDHVKLAIGADYFDASPIRGVRVGGGSEAMTAEASVQQSAEQ